METLLSGHIRGWRSEMGPLPGRHIIVERLQMETPTGWLDPASFEKTMTNKE